MSGRRGIFAGFGCLALGLVATTSAQAAEQGELMRDAMSSIGLIEPERPAITYNERAPLVMPPNLAGKPAAKRANKKGAPKEADATPPLLDLPVPQTRQADPQWPKDPEISRRERAAIEAKKPVSAGAQGRVNDNNMTLGPYEMQAGRKAGAGLNSGPGGTESDTRDSIWMNPLQLFSGRKDDVEPSAVEPEREALSDPPTGYRKAPVKVAKPEGLPVGGSISGNEEADPKAYQREQRGR